MVYHSSIEHSISYGSSLSILIVQIFGNHLDMCLLLNLMTTLHSETNFSTIIEKSKYKLVRHFTVSIFNKTRISETYIFRITSVSRYCYFTIFYLDILYRSTNISLIWLVQAHVDMPTCFYYLNETTAEEHKSFSYKALEVSSESNIN